MRLFAFSQELEADNHESVSPSVYAYFTGVGALDKCGLVGGGTFPTLDLKFNPTDLSTSSTLVNPSLGFTFKPLGQWTAINYADFGPYRLLPIPLLTYPLTDQCSQCICTTNCEFYHVLYMRFWGHQIKIQKVDYIDV